MTGQFFQFNGSRVRFSASGVGVEVGGIVSSRVKVRVERSVAVRVMDGSGVGLSVGDGGAVGDVEYVGVIVRRVEVGCASVMIDVQPARKIRIGRRSRDGA
jgi:hypothetical protein